MDERGWWSRIAAVVGAFVSFRVAVAMTTSVGVTAAVAGPMALAAYDFRHPTPEAAADVPVRPSDPAAPTPTAPERTTTSTTTTTTTTTTTVPEGVPVTVPGTVAPPAPTTSTAPAAVGPDGLAAGVRSDRADAVALEGATLTGTVYVYATIDGATAVRFWVDDPDGTGAPTRTDAAAPFDLGDPAVDTTTLSAGSHTLSVEATTASGTERRRATFTVIR